MTLFPEENMKIVPIPGYEQYYGATIDGRVYSFNYRRTGKVVELAQSSRYDKRRFNDTMYRRAKMWHIAKKIPTAIHRLIALTFIPNPDNLPQVNHKDGDKGNNHASNLEWCSVKQNMMHAEASGLANHPVGEDHPMHILTHDKASAIKAIFANEPVYRGQLKDLAAIYGVSKCCILAIKQGRAWKHL